MSRRSRLALDLGPYRGALQRGLPRGRCAPDCSSWPWRRLGECSGPARSIKCSSRATSVVPLRRGGRPSRDRGGLRLSGELTSRSFVTGSALMVDGGLSAIDALSASGWGTLRSGLDRPMSGRAKAVRSRGYRVPSHLGHPCYNPGAIRQRQLVPPRRQKRSGLRPTRQPRQSETDIAARKSL